MVQDEEQGKLGLEEEIAGIGETIQKIRAEAEREQKRKDRLDKELKALKISMESKTEGSIYTFIFVSLNTLNILKN